jgi:GT2 family glycosyltransferase/glycosyltransferase involved in cell wall biosynthesis
MHMRERAIPVTAASEVAKAAELLASAPSPVIVVAIHNAYEDAVRCLDAVVAHTPTDISVLVVDDGGLDRRMPDFLVELDDRLAHHVVVLRQPTNRGFVRCCNDAFEASAGRDVVLVNSDVIVGPGWLERLSDAANSDSTIATATTLTNHGSIVSAPTRNTPRSQLPDGMTPDEAARRVAAASLRLRPSIPTAVAHCCYIRRQALDLVGPFDVAFDPGYAEEVDFSQRALALGMRHILADDVFTYHRGGGSFGSSPEVETVRAHHEAMVRQRYPWYESMMRHAAEDPASGLADAVSTARRALIGLTVGIDALILGPHRMGTQEVVIQTIRTLARRREIARLVVFTPTTESEDVANLREELPDVEFFGVNPYLPAPERVVDVAYRPNQVNELAELNFLARCSERFVVNQLDTISYENPAYFADGPAWIVYRDLTRLVMQLANGVAFVSQRSVDAAHVAGLLLPGTPRAVVSCGLERDDDGSPGEPPAGLDPGADGFLLCLGASYLHKNRRFALEVWAELRARGWPGGIVLAGPTPPHGSSLAHEAAFGLTVGQARHEIVTLDAVSADEKRWLYQHAALVLYPSLNEGFGLVPFEAALHGVATLASRHGSLDEVLPPELPTLDGFDVSAAADAAWLLLHDAEAKARVVQALQERAGDFTWSRTADRLLELFDEALRRPRGRVLAIEGEGELPIGLGARSQRIGDSSNQLERLVNGVISRPRLKRTLSPDGSRRQRAARAVIATARRRIH